MSLPDRKKLNYAVLNPAVTEENYIDRPHEKITCMGFSSLSELLPIVISLDEFSAEEYKRLIAKAEIGQSLSCAFVSSPLSAKDLATELSLNLKQKKEDKWHYFWFVAPKIMTYLQQVLNSNQQRSLLSAVTEWHYFDTEWSQTWRSWVNRKQVEPCTVLEMSLAQWDLIEVIPDANRTKFFLDAAAETVREKKEYALIREIDALNNPLSYLKLVAQINKEYPIEANMGLGQFIQDYLEDKEQAKIIYQEMKSIGSEDYMIATRKHKKLIEVDIEEH